MYKSDKEDNFFKIHFKNGKVVFSGESFRYINKYQEYPGVFSLRAVSSGSPNKQRLSCRVTDKHSPRSVRLHKQLPHLGIPGVYQPLCDFCIEADPLSIKLDEKQTNKTTK